MRPVYGDRHGHPVVWRRDVLALLDAAEPAQGARPSCGRWPHRALCCDVPVDDAGVLSDLDTPEDYAVCCEEPGRPASGSLWPWTSRGGVGWPCAPRPPSRTRPPPSMPPSMHVAAPPSSCAAEAVTPPLKWAGGKRWQLPILRPLWEKSRHRRLVEPFRGGLAVPLGLRPEAALLNDLNPHLVNFYRWLQRGLLIDLALENDRDLYYAHRARFNALLAAGAATTPEAASLFYFLNRTGYNGLCRFNKRTSSTCRSAAIDRSAYVADLRALPRRCSARWIVQLRRVRRAAARAGRLRLRRSAV